MQTPQSFAVYKVVEASRLEGYDNKFVIVQSSLLVVEASRLEGYDNLSTLAVLRVSLLL